jgi:hypothetical protein
MSTSTTSLSSGWPRKETNVTNPTATISECLQVHGSLDSNETEELSEHWASLDTRLKSFEPTQVAMNLFVKDRDTVSQHLTLEAKIADWPTLVATTSEPEFGHALNVVRDEMIRLIGDAKETHWGYRKGGPRSSR